MPRYFETLEHTYDVGELILARLARGAATEKALRDRAPLSLVGCDTVAAALEELVDAGKVTKLSNRRAARTGTRINEPLFSAGSVSCLL